MRLSGNEKYLLLIIFLSQLMVLLGAFLNSLTLEISLHDAYKAGLSGSIGSIIIGGMLGSGVFLYVRAIIRKSWQIKVRVDKDLFEPAGLYSDNSIAVAGVLFACLLFLSLIAFARDALNSMHYIIFYIMWIGFGISAFCTAI